MSTRLRLLCLRSVVFAYLGSLKMAALLQAGGAGGGGSRSRGGERDEQVNEGADNEAVRLLAVGPEVPPEHLLEPAPVVGAVAQHHLLHGPPEVAVRVGRLDGQRRGAVERRGRLFRLHDGARGLGLEQEPAGGGGAEAVDDRLVLVRGDFRRCWNSLLLVLETRPNGAVLASANEATVGSTVLV